MKKIYLILLLGLLLRLISLNQSLWLDEGIQWWASSTFSIPHLATEYIKGDFNPPLYHVILHIWIKIFGVSEISLRFPSVLFGLGTVYFVYKIGGHKAALLAATAPLLIYYSQEARMYSLSAFAVTATIYFMLKRQKLPYVIFLSLALYSHYLTWLLLPVLLYYFFLPTIISILSFIPFFPIFIQQLTQGLGTATNPAWAGLSSLSIKAILLVPIKFLIGRIPVDFTPIYAFILFTPLCFVAYLFYKSLPCRQAGRDKKLLSLFFVPLVLGAIISLKVPVFTYFRFLYLVPIFYLIISQKLHSYAFYAFIAFNLLTTSYYLLATSNHREDWRSATSYIHMLDNQAPVIIYAPVRPPFDYYNQDKSMILSDNQLDQLIGQPDAWFISYAQPIFDPQQKVKTTLENLGFQEISARHFRGVTVIRYKNFSAKLFSYVQ